MRALPGRNSGGLPARGQQLPRTGFAAAIDRIVATRLARKQCASPHYALRIPTNRMLSLRAGRQPTKALQLPRAPANTEYNSMLFNDNCENNILATKLRRNQAAILCVAMKSVRIRCG